MTEFIVSIIVFSIVTFGAIIALGVISIVVCIDQVDAV